MTAIAPTLSAPSKPLIADPDGNSWLLLVRWRATMHANRRNAMLQVLEIQHEKLIRIITCTATCETSQDVYARLEQVVMRDCDIR